MSETRTAGMSIAYVTPTSELESWHHNYADDARALARFFLDRQDEDWTYIDPDDVKRLARAVLDE